MSEAFSPLTPGTSSAPTEAATGPSGQTTSLERTSIQARYEREVDAVLEAYPGTHVWRDNEGMWLLSESSVVAELDGAATFLTAISWTDIAVRGWGFWRESPLSLQWIGPRHTNFPDGSICAFDPRDATWTFGDSIVALLDLYDI